MGRDGMGWDMGRMGMEYGDTGWHRMDWSGMCGGIRKDLVGLGGGQVKGDIGWRAGKG